MQILNGHDGPIHAIAFAPDGQTLVSAGKDGTLRSWDAGGEGTELLKSDAPVASLAWSSDGRRLASGGADGTVVVNDLEAEQVKVFRPMGTSSITGLAFLPGDATLAISAADEPDRTGNRPGLCLFEWKTGKARSLPIDQAATGSVRTLANHRSTRMLGWATEQRVLSVWNQMRPDPWRLHLKSPCRALAFSADGKLLAASADWKVTLYEVERRVERATLIGHKGVVAALAFSPDDRILVTGSWDKTLRFWDPATGVEKTAYEWPVGRISATTFSQDGLRAAVAGDAGAIVIWDVDE